MTSDVAARDGPDIAMVLPEEVLQDDGPVVTNKLLNLCHRQRSRFHQRGIPRTQRPDLRFDVSVGCQLPVEFRIELRRFSSAGIRL